MRSARATILGITLALTLVLGSASVLTLAQKRVEITPPLLVTSAGQSPDALMVRVLLSRLGIPVTVNEMAEAEELDGVKTLFVVMGGSQKGLGAAGIDTFKELQRVASILDRAEADGMTIIGVHIGGEGRRGPLSHEFIEAVTPRTHFLIVTDDGNRDGYFTDAARELGIGIRTVPTTLEVGNVIQELMEGE